MNELAFGIGHAAVVCREISRELALAGRATASKENGMMLEPKQLSFKRYLTHSPAFHNPNPAARCFVF